MSLRSEFLEFRHDMRRQLAELRGGGDGERAVLIRAIQLMEILVSKQLDDLTAAMTALTAAVTALIAKAGTPAGPDESVQLEAVATAMQGLVTDINAALAPKTP